MFIVISGTAHHARAACTVIMYVVSCFGETSQLLAVLQKDEFFHCEALSIYKDCGDNLKSFPWPQTASQLVQILAEYRLIYEFLLLKLQKAEKNRSVLVRFGWCQCVMNSLQSESFIRTAEQSR